MQLLPLLGALVLLRKLPTIAETPLGGVFVLPWRLDALALVFLLSGALAVAAVPLRPHQLLVALAYLMLLVPALLLEHLLALPAALLLVALALRSRRLLLATLLLSAGLAWPYATAGAGWNDPLVAPAFGAPVATVLLAAVAAGLAPWPPRRNSDPMALAVLPLWLLPLLRMIGLQPLRAEWGLLALAAGSVLTLWNASVALRGTDQQRAAAVATGWLAAALASMGLLTTAGIAATLYGLLAYPLALGLLLRAPRLAAPLPLSAAFVSAWLAVGAVAASGAWLAAAALLLAALGSGVALVVSSPAPPGLLSREERGGTRQTYQPQGPPPSLRGLGDGGSSGLMVQILLAASWTLGIVAPPLIQLIILPAIDLLQGGLTPFGLVAVWPWIGVAALDAGQRRVATLPTVAAALWAIAPAAGAWLVARVLARRAGRLPTTPAGTQAASRRVWWLGARRGG